MAYEAFTLEVNGIQYQGLLSASATTSLEQLSGEFKCDVTMPQNGTFPIKRGNECRILIYGTPIITGFINKIDMHLDANSHTISVCGRDKTCDIIDNTLPPVVTFNTPISIIDLTKKVLNIYGITNINVSTDIEDLDIFNASEKVAAEVGESAFDFLEKYAKKRQVILSTDGNGNILYTRAQAIIVSDFINVNQGINKGNVLSIDMSVDDSKRFYKYILSSQDKNGGTAVITNYNQLHDQPTSQAETYATATAIDDEIRNTRTHNFLSDTTYVDQKARQDRAEWEKNVRRANGFTYEISVQGFKNIKGEVWRPNMLLNINDTINDVYADLLILSTEFTLNLDGGTQTKLTLTTPDAFQVILQKKTKKDKKAKKLADKFNLDVTAENDELEENDESGDGE